MSAKAYSMVERRRQPRVKVSLAAELHLAGRTILGRVRDLSAGGAYFQLAEDDAPPGAREGHLFAPALGAMVAVDVRNVRLYAGIVAGLGLELREPNPLVSERIRGFVDAFSQATSAEDASAGFASPAPG